MVEVTLVKLTEGYPLWEEGLNFVSEERKARVNGFWNLEDKKRCLLSELLMKKAYFEKLAMPLNQIKINYNLYHKPFFAGSKNFEFNVSHSDSYVVFALSKNTIGIDIEKIKKINFNIAKRFYTEKEYKSIISLPTYTERLHHFYTLWTLKESYVKAIGMGLNLPLHTFEFVLNDKEIFVNSQVEQEFSFYTGEVEDYSISICHKEKKQEYTFSWFTEEEIYKYFHDIDLAN